MNSAPRLRLEQTKALFEEAKCISPGGIMGIRKPSNFVEGEYPVYISKGYDCHLVDVDGNDYLDMLCSYGPIILGHSETEIDDAVIGRMKKGFCFTLAQPLQNILIKKLIEIIPSAEMVILLKTGSDATGAAVRLARAHTGRPKIFRCGYHGWHDWCVELHGGVPAEILDLTVEFPYGDLDALDRLLGENRGRVAGVILTPVGHHLAQPVIAPPPGYLEGVRALADQHGCVLIFDEIRTGFRLAIGGAQMRYGVTPDISVFGKAMANGYPISACVGKAEVMKAAEKNVLISSTFNPNTLEMAASLKCIEILEREGVLERIWARGEVFLQKLNRIVDDSGIPAAVSELPPMPFITFEQVDDRWEERRRCFFTEAIRRRLLIQPDHHWYIAHRHTDEDLEYALQVIGEALAVTAKRYPL